MMVIVGEVKDVSAVVSDIIVGVEEMAVEGRVSNLPRLRGAVCVEPPVLTPASRVLAEWRCLSFLARVRSSLRWLGVGEAGRSCSGSYSLLLGEDGGAAVVFDTCRIVGIIDSAAVEPGCLYPVTA